MKKFTRSHLNDSDSNKSMQSLRSGNETETEKELPRIISITILIPYIRKKTKLKIIGDAAVVDIKRKLLKAFGSIFSDGQNMGFFLPGEKDKMGKFMEEERLLSEYIGNKSEIIIEFVYKCRIVQPSLSSPTMSASINKELQKKLLRYVERSDYRNVKEMLKDGFDPNFHCTKTGETPLTIAVTRAKPKNMICTLIEHGAHRDFYSKAGNTALHQACILGNFESVQNLLDFGQSPNSLNKDGLTPLYCNIMHDQDTRICHRLLYEHSVIGVPNSDGLLELHQASRLNRLAQIDLLIMYGADVNCRTVRPATTNLMYPFTTTANGNNDRADGDTPLHVAASTGQQMAVMRLLSRGADPTLINAANLTAVQLAKSRGYTQLSEEMRRYPNSSHHNENGDPFLPAPTYNTRRHMRRLPPNSYITKPTELVCMFADNTKENCSTPVITKGRLPNSRTEGQLNQLTQSSNGPIEQRTNLVDPSKLTLHSSTVTRVPRSTSLVNLLKSSNQNISINNNNHSGNFTIKRIYANGSINDRCSINVPNIYAQGYTSPRMRQYDQQVLGSQSNQMDPRKTQTWDHFRVNSGYIPHRSPQPLLYGLTAPPLQSWKSTENLNEEFKKQYVHIDSGISDSSEDRVSSGGVPSELNGYPHQVQQSIMQKDFRTTRPPNLNVSTTKHTAALSEASKFHNPKDNQYEMTPPDGNTLLKSKPTTTTKISPPLYDKLFPTAKIERCNSSVYRTRKITLRRMTINENETSGARSAFGFTIRTVKPNHNVVKPSLQSATLIMPNSPASRAGMQEGDYILEINGVDVTHALVPEVSKLLTATVGDTVSLLIANYSPCKQPYGASSPNLLQSSLNAAENFKQVSLNAQSKSPVILPFQRHSSEHTGVTKLSKLKRAVYDSNKSNTPSARSSDRTTCSSITDEGVWTQSSDWSSNNASGRSLGDESGSTVSHRLKETNCTHKSTQGGSQQNATSELTIHRAYGQGLVRSRTTTGISNVNEITMGTGNMANSFYFPRYGAFQRVVSQDSDPSSSVNSSGAAPDNSSRHRLLRSPSVNISTTQRRAESSNFPNTYNKAIGPNHGLSNSKIKEGYQRLCRPELIGIDYKSPTTNSFHQSNLNCENRCISSQHTLIGDESPTETEIVLPPPVEFRS